MEVVTDFTQFEQGSSTRRVKSRSKACLHCRRRKMRCDGVKPSCFQCVRAERASECEYDDGITKTSTQVLYERLAMLEKRYRDLQAAKRPTQSRRAPSYPRATANPAVNANGTNVNLMRSNSAPGRVHSRPGVNGNGPHHQSISDSFLDVHDAHRSFSFTNYGPIPTSSGFVHMDDNVNPQPFDMHSSSLSSRSSSHSGRSTPSTSDFSHNDLAFHPRYAFAYGIQQGSGTQSPYIQPTSDLGVASVPHVEMGVSPRELQDFAGHAQVPRKLTTNLYHSVGEISPALLEHLIDNFVAHSQQAGATILSNRLLDILYVSASHISPALSCLVNFFLLWGARFSNIESVRSRQEHFLQGVLATLPSLLSAPLAVPMELVEYQSSDSTADGRFNVVFAIITSTMLATYFFAEGRALEGSYHANTASQLAICAGLHHTPDPRFWRNSPGNGGNDSTYGDSLGLKDGLQVSPDPKVIGAARSNTDLLPLPMNLSCALERHHIFWNVFVLDRAWSAAGRLPAPSSRWSAPTGDAGNLLKDKDPRTAIATPWPEDWGLLLIDDPKENTPASPIAPTRSPVEDFLTGVDDHPTRSILQLRAKSVVLFEAASRVASLKNPYHPEAGCDASFVSLQRTISAFLRMLPPISSPDFHSPSCTKSSQYTTHTLVHAAIIRLYSTLAEKAYKEGFAGNPVALFSHANQTSETTVQRVIDGLLGYERVLQHGMSDANADLTKTDHSPAGSVGMAYAAVDQCLSSAREIVRIANGIVPDDFSFLEPIIVPCWALASEVLLRELKRLLAAHQSSEKMKLISELHVLETSLKYLGAVFPIGNIEGRKLSAALASITDGFTPYGV